VTTMVTAAVILTASSRLPMRKETAADPRSSRMRVSLNCLRKRNHSGSLSSWVSSLWPWSWMRAVASEGDRPWERDVASFWAVWDEERMQ
jgi:hypothetical protein